MYQQTCTTWTNPQAASVPLPHRGAKVGVRTLDDIPKGSFVCTYIGHIYSEAESDQVRGFLGYVYVCMYCVINNPESSNIVLGGLRTYTVCTHITLSPHL